MSAARSSDGNAGAGPRIVYLDHAATTPLLPEVADAMGAQLRDTQGFANPASDHVPGRAAALRVAQAREQVAEVLGAEAHQIVWTSGATEANNLAILGIARGSQWRGRKLITSSSEHPAVVETCKALEREGFQVVWLAPGPEGVVHSAALRAALSVDTVLVSLMHVNNETGAVQDIAGFGAVCREAGVPLHVDAAQSAGKLPLDLRGLPIDLLSISAHKIHGPKGAGALVVADTVRPRLQPLMHGGGHEQGLRPGTLATHQIVGLAAALTAAAAVRADESRRLSGLREHLWSGLMALGGVLPNSPLAGSPWIANFAFEGVEGESLRQALWPIAVSGGAACTSAQAGGSAVLRGLGRDDQLARASLRFSFGRETSWEEIDAALAVVARELPRLRALAPIPEPATDMRRAAR